MNSRMKQSILGGLDNFGQTNSQMKSLIKSFSNNNIQFYEDLHKKYFGKAKENDQSQFNKSLKPPTASQIQSDKTDKDLFTLTSKSNTMLGLSQLNYTSSVMQKNLKDSVGSSLSKPSGIRSSSNRDSNKHKHLSINQKSSLYMKMHPTLDEHSQLVFKDGRASSTKHLMQESKGKKSHMYLDSSSSDEEHDQKTMPIDISSHI